MECLVGFNHNYMKIFTLFVASIFLFVGSVCAQITVNNTPTAQQLAELLAGSNLVVSNATITGDALAKGSFGNGTSNLGMTSGVILSTGRISTAPGPNTAGNTSNNNGDPGTTQMTALAGINTFDAITLQFDFTVQSDFIQFNYVFASEEYPEYAPPINYGFNDVFAFYISGPGITGEENIALIPNTTLPVSINNINVQTNNQYYVDNLGGTEISFDAFTTVMTARKDGLIPCQTYTLKLVIADAGDADWNSAVFLQENSLVQGLVEVSTNTINSDNIALEGCIKASFTFELDQPSAVDKTITYQIAGTATNGVDYSPIANSLTIPAGQTQAQIFIDAISDGIPESQETILIIYKPEICADWDTAFLYIDDAQPITYTLDGVDLDCYGNQSGQILVNASGGFPPYTYHVTDPGGQITQYSMNPITGMDAGQYTVFVYDSYGCKAEALVVGGLFNAGTTFLPDGSGVTYSSSINITGFSPGQTLTNIADLQNICLNMEHSYLGDLIVTLQAPGGQSVQLKGAGGGTCDLGEPIATNPIDGSASSTLVDPGVGYDYCFNNSPMYGTMSAMSNTFYRNYTDGQGHSYSDYYLPGGSYTASQSLSNLLGTTLNGTWTVFVTDQMLLDNGYIFNWSISFLGDLPDTVVEIEQPDPIDVTSFITNATCGSSNGAINISVTGNYPAFTYLWNTGASTEDISGLPAGTYSLTVTDAHACQDSSQFAVSNVSSLALSSVINPVSCAGSNNGSINVTVSGGTPGYTYAWSHGPTTEDVSNLIAGSYSVTVTDFNGCQLIRLFDVSSNAPVQISLLNLSNEMCSTGNGSISVSATGGSGSYGYNWSNGASGSFLSNLHTGTYALTVSDAYGCTSTASWFVPNDVSNCAAYCYLNITENSVVDDQCGQSVGSIDISINQATLPYYVEWSNTATTEDISNLTQNTYSVTVTDANQCVATRSIAVGNNTGSLNISLNGLLNETCGSGNGSIDITANGGALPYQYAWSNAASTEDLSNLAAGSYTLTLTDANNCSITSSYNVSNDAGDLQVTAVITHDACGGHDGIITQSVTGGFGLKTFVWSNGSHLQSIAGLSAGSYVCTITDAGGCSLVRNYNVANLSGPVSITNVAVTNENCGNGLGSINITATGTGLSYLWSNAATSEDISGLSEGIYSCTVSNALGCSAVSGDIHVFNSPGTIAVVLNSVGDEVCGNGLGYISIDVSGGTAPLTYLWSNGSSSQDAYSLHAGIYTLTITDFGGCEFIYSAEVENQQGTLEVQNAVVTNESCGHANGAINMILSGGTAPLSYLWSNSATSEDLSALTAGTYTITVTDGNGCKLYHSEQIVNLANNLSSEWQITNELCGDASGAIDLSVNGGTAPYSYAWSNASTSQDINSLSAGTYYCTITDNTACHLLAGPMVVNNATAGLTANVVANNASCGQANGSIDLTVNGGSLPITYLWSNAANTQDISGLLPGVYGFTVTDANGCSTDGSAQVLNTSGNLAVSYIITDESCNNNNGSIDLTTSGGTAPITFLWNGGQSTEDRTALNSGNYTCTISDAAGCQLVTPVITVADNPGTLEITSFVVTNEVCNHNNGRINISVSGGTPAYTYLWSNAASTEDLINLNAGLYIVTVTDAAGCRVVSQGVVYDDNGSFSISDFVVTNEHCDDNSGAVNISVSGGTLPYAYTWSNGASSQNISGLSEGDFSVYVTDASGCTDNGNYEVLNLGSDLSITQASVTNDICHGSTGEININYTGGVAPLSFIWSNGSNSQNALNLSAGTYSLTITDVNGCNVVGTWDVMNQPGTLELTGSASDEYCGNGVGSLLVSVSGGASPYNYIWSNGALTEDQYNLHGGTYSLTVTDQSGCTIEFSELVENNTSGLVVVLDSVVNELCGQSDGGVYLSVTGGAPPYDISWNSGPVSEDITNLNAGSYSVTVTDATSCSYSLATNVINVTGGMAVSFSNIQNESCDNGQGFIDIEVTGGIAPYDYLWSSGDFTQDLTSLHQGTYSVTITDDAGCEMVQTYIVTNGSGTNIAASGIVDNAICESPSGGINVSVSGGISPFTYDWSNGAITQDLNNVVAGTYTLTITDDVGCTTIESFFIDEETNPSLQFYYVWVTDDYCLQNQGQIMWDGLGGSPYTYYINGLPTPTSNVGALGAGQYIVSVVDHNGCRLDSNVTILNTSNMTAVADFGNDFCGANDGWIDIDVTAPGALTYLWSNGATTEDLSGIGAGSYTCTFSTPGCYDQITIDISDSYDFSISGVTTDEFCSNGVGSINQTPDLTMDVFDYAWSNGETTQDLSGLHGGIYTCTVTNTLSGCQRIVTYTIGSATTGIAVNTVISSDTCSMGIGSCTNVIFGGSGNYDYFWGHGPTTMDLYNLPGGNYTFTAVDVNDNCSTIVYVCVPDVKTFNATGVSSDASCSYCTDGYIDLIVNDESGFTNTFTYEWSHGTSTQDVTGLTPGSYTVTVTSDSGCDTVMTFSIGFPDNLSVDASVKANLFIDPNPASDQCLLSWEILAGEKASLQITDLSGHKLRYWMISASGAQMYDVSMLAPGTYLVTLQTNSGAIRKKLVVVR